MIRVPQTPRIEFTDAIKTGDEAMDSQHRYLIGLINEIADIIDAGTAERELGRILPLLQFYVEWHFDREEQCMFRRECPFAKVNKDAHTVFIKTVADLKARYHAEGASQEFAEEIYSRLTNWLVDHIIKVDSTMRDYPDRHPLIKL